MGAIEQSAILELNEDDASAGLALSEEARWNQTEADWRFFLRDGTVFGLRDANGGLIATAALLPYGDGNAWISMVLVTASWQRRGIATRLLDACLDAAAKRKLTTWLDATTAGAAVYGPLGFTPSIQLKRLTFADQMTPSVQIAPLREVGLSELIARDRRVMGFDRSALLAELAGREGSRIITHDGALALVRNGHAALHIGPVYADHTASTIALIAAVVGSQTGSLLIDVAADQHKLVDSLTQSGWTNQRTFQRMRFGRIRTRGTELPFAGAGPEYG